MKRADPTLQEMVDALDDHLEQCGGSEHIAEASDCLGAAANAAIDVELDRCVNSFRYYAENWHVIRRADGELGAMYPFRESQNMMDELIEKRIAETGKAKIVICKSRQVGGSEYAEARILWRTVFRPGSHNLVAAQDPGQSTYLMDKSRLAYDNLPWWMRPAKRYEQRGKLIEFDHKDPAMRQSSPGLKSVIFAESANKVTGVAIGKQLRTVHLCLTENNGVLLPDGYIKSIADLRVGETVLGGNGGAVTVSAWSQRSAEGERAARVTPWCNSAFPIEGTWCHQVKCVIVRRQKLVTHVVPQGWKTLGEIVEFKPASVNHRLALVYPVRPITSTGAMPAPDYLRSVRPQSGGKQPGKFTPTATREWGFAVGLFLAEGTILKQQSGRPSGVCLSLDSDEEGLAARFAKCVGAPVPKPRKGRNGSRTRVYAFYNSALGRWFRENVGELQGKTIPDWCWTVGRDFLAGVVEGLILGDGHLSAIREIYLSTTRVQMAIRLREACMSLGYGYAGIYYRPAGEHYGRNCQEIWTVCITHAANEAMRREFGWPESPVSGKKAEYRHWQYSPDRSEVWVFIRSACEVEVGLVYDIEVNDPCHSFLLAGAVTHNSELSSWENERVLNEQLFPAMRLAPDLIAIMESTSRGRDGFWYPLWLQTLEGKFNDWVPLFIPAYVMKEYSIPIDPKVTFEPTEEEKGIAERILHENGDAVPMEHFAWRREVMAEFNLKGEDPDKFMQEYPETWRESFQSSGLCAFDKRALQYILNTTVERPFYVGEIRLEGMRKPAIDLEEHDPHEEPPSTENVGGRLRVWRLPESGAEYYIGGDVAMGNGGDFSCAEVLKIGRGMEPDEQVAEWHGWISPTPFAGVLAALGYWYNGAEIACELNDCGGITGSELWRILEYEKLYVWKHTDKIKNFMTDYLGWKTNSKNKDDLIVKMREAVSEKTIILRSADLIEEMFDFGNDGGGRFAAVVGNDDRVMASMICRYCCHESDIGTRVKSESGNALAKIKKRPAPYGMTDWSPIHDRPQSQEGLLHREHGVPAEFVALVSRSVPDRMAIMFGDNDDGDGWRRL